MSADAGASRKRLRSARGAPISLVLLLALAAPAAAHLGNLSTSEIVARGNEVDFRLRFAAHLIPGSGTEAGAKLTRRDVVTREGALSEWLLGGIFIDMGGARCKGELVDSMGPDMNDDLTVVLHYTCPAASDALRVEFRAFDQILPDYENIASIRHTGGSSSYVFTTASRVLVIGGGTAAAAASAGASANDADASSTFYRFFRLGIDHIFGGYEHLLFLLALLLPGGSVGRLAGIVTAFTVAQAITLAVAMTGMLTPPPAALIEAAIAASVTLAAFNATRALRNDEARDHRALLTFAFGLVHGFSFAGFLHETGLPASAVAMPLFAINVGIEVAQLAVVLVVAPLIAVVARSALGRRLITAAAWLTATVGTFWLAERLAAWMYP